MIQSTVNYSVFYHHHTTLGQCIYLTLYVDDIVITSNDQDGIRKLKHHLFSHFQTKDLEKLKYFLRIEVAQSDYDLIISHMKYTLDILEETGILNCKSMDAPMDPNAKLIPGQGESLLDLGRYQQWSNLDFLLL